MTTQLEAMKMALEGFAVSFSESNFGAMKREQAINALRTAIKAAESMEDLRYCQEYCNQLPITSKLGAGGTGEGS